MLKKTELLTIIICLLMLAIPGCLVIWTDQAFILSFAKTADANDLDMIAEPNYLQIGSGQTRTKNDPIKAITPYGVVEKE